jgi:uncharacterized membrane protein YtjA (UPF0391 family)
MCDDVVPKGRRNLFMFHYAAWFVVISCLAVLFEFGGLVTGSAEMARILALLFLVMFLVSVVATLVLNRDKRPSRSSPRHDHFRRIRTQGRAPD